jgi:hypothetical protein
MKGLQRLLGWIGLSVAQNGRTFSLMSTASVVSDHCPLILGLKVSTKGKRCFHFGSFWTKIPGFLDAVQQNWNAPVASSLAAACHAPCQSPGFFLCG